MVVLPSCHKKWDINCTKILQGNKEEIRRSVRLLNVWRLDPKRPTDPFMPSDNEVRTWTHDCDVFKRARHYRRQPTSVEEADFPMAYIIVVHRGSAQVERLLKAIYQPQNIYCIHPDRKAPGDFKSAIKGLADCFENVFVASRTESVIYAGYTRLLADVNCMRDLIGQRASGYAWKYVINLCGQDFPLKSNLEIVKKLKSYNGHNDISGSEPSGGKRLHTTYRYVDKPGGPHRTEERKPSAPHNIHLRTGIAYYIATRAFVHYVLTNQTAIDFLEWTNGTYSPDETYWASLQQVAGTPGGRYQPPGGSVIRFIRWYGKSPYPRCRGKMIRMVCVFSMGYTQHLTKVKHLFANKFDYAFDPIALQCIEEAFEFRTLHPGAPN
ncbi:beta-1,3-galactosyl-O-glycosyl-glycoprotein beta-1,6-N-acetylglucosaminyltransferase-like [Asterias rubens]|uniref:beta-1,3-galactosyl-O-glycosyl-glycoprotein beta-1,6-N-acetylglucosaminyltransferase-like n=1 Tax=Asterias rubens TaxID=7604 RepID=UPI001455D426|nr:beta-1,3-galactosyl-O-glycosyl-glycoprotein beta-1,6-N-acetylglucosaminyltransferase-like [Asterias rubens]